MIQYVKFANILDFQFENSLFLMRLLFLWFKDSCEYNFDTQTNCPPAKPVKHSAPHTPFCQFVHLCHFVAIYRPFCLRYFLHSSGDGFPILPTLKEVNLFYWLFPNFTRTETTFSEKKENGEKRM